MNRSIRLAAGTLLLVSLAACNKRNEVVTNDPMAENSVIDLPTEEVNVRRHRAQQPANIYTSRWRYSLMNWGHDPVKELDG